MRKPFAILLAALSLATSAAPADPKFAEQKQKQLDRIHQHQKIIATLESCVQAAQDRPTAQQCAAQYKQAAAALKAVGQ